MKKYLIIIYQYYPHPSANSHCVKSIIDRIIAKGDSVDVICSKKNRELPDLEVIDNVKVHRIENTYEQIIVDFYKKRDMSVGYKKTVYHFLGAILSLITYINHDRTTSMWPTKKIVKKISELHVIDPFNSLITVSMPFTPHIIGAKIKKKFKEINWIAYELDPFAYNYVLNKKQINQRKKLEIKTYKKADKIISTMGISEENTRQGFRTEYLYKNHVVNLPNLVIEEMETKSINGKDVSFPKDKINMVFTGYFYKNIRNPEEMLLFFDSLKNPDFNINIFGGNCEDILEKYKKKLGDNLILHGPVDKSISELAIKKADFLINVGNNLPNQTPSKIFDYIKTGKPIIHFYYNDSDTCLSILKYTPNSICIKMKPRYEIEEKSYLLNFCDENINNILSIELIEKNMNDFLSENVCEKFLSIVEEK